MTDPQFSASHDGGIPPAPSEPTASSSTSDPTSSLRAAALLTLKSKRRKAQPTLTSTLPIRPLPENTLQLDYGTEESPSVPQDTSPAPTVEPPKPPPPPETQTREEGEISDEEDTQPTPAPPKPPSPAPSQPPPDTNLRRPRYPTPSTTTLPQQHSSRPKLSLSERISDAPSIPGSATLSQGDMLDHMQPDLFPSFEDPRYLLDADHVRPGVALNQVQYDRAKDTVLDLLGWGVAPEYLVDCGLTREIVFYVFSELNLRLPENLDTTGLIPYTPDMRFLAERRKSALMPPPPPPQSLRYSDGQLNLSPPAPAQLAHPSPPTVPSPAPPADTRADPATLPTVDAPHVAVTGNLHDMEQQRRQELLARKAVIASRKSKQAAAAAVSALSSGALSSASTSAPGSRQDVEMAVPSETVDDFLKTIGPSPTVGESSTVSNSLSPRPQTDDMDVDDIPGLSGTRQYNVTAPVPSRGESGLPSLDAAVVSPAQSSHTPTSPDACPPSSTESTATVFVDKSGSHTPSDSPALPEGPALQRRGAKRPVAADFVDLDGGSRPSTTGNGAYTTGMHPGARRKTGSGFANVASARRFIIDLSDSEGEGDGDVVMRDAGPRETAGRRSAYPSPGPGRPTVTILNTNGWATPPISTSTPATTANTSQSAILSPAALVEKEKEIQKMRELIAQREQRRLQKLAAAKANIGTGTGTSAESTSVSVKREETPVSIPTENMSNLQDAGAFQQPPQPLDQLATASGNASSRPSGSASASATPPIDFDTRNGASHALNATPEGDTADKVVIAEAQQKHVARIFSPRLL
ncbi:hypothetical protein LshimejAT787_0502390 [Lyophyllum shimeji]|uniref:Uncharacterized protein n=1 Tax=Lyophyllum shimeji TaxID=47721 RepID=A0A9P3PMV5_LYOSH|nr:hypothetical protein LshimejAT787_0502390 [Lyophyllum shimeji]